MKPFLPLIAAATALASLFSCSGVNADSESGAGAYTLTLPTRAADDGMLAYLVDFDSDAKLDSVIIGQGFAKFTGSVDTARVVRVLIDGKRRGMAVLEAGDIMLDSTTRMATGTRLNNLLSVVALHQDSLMSAYGAAVASDSMPDSLARARRSEIMTAYNELTSRTIADNQSNPVGAYLLLQEAYELSPAGLDSLLSAYPAVKPGVRLTRLKEAMRLKAETMPGRKFKDFEVVVDTVRYKLSNHVGRGHYTLVDFWASWCGPCIRETETIKRIYNAYNDKGLEVLGVAVWDEIPDTRRAIEQHQLPWHQIIGTQRIATDVYGISSIPCIILFDPQGNIVARDLTGDDLEAAVAKAMTAKEVSAAD